MRLLTTIAALVLTTGCLVDPGVNPDGARLWVQERVEVDWDEAFDGIDDGIGTLVPVDVMVYDGTSGEPLEGIDITVHSSSLGVRPALPENVLAVDPDDCGCDAVWDIWVDDYYELSPEPEPSTIEGVVTDEDGLVRLYLFVDALPPPDGADDVTIAVDIGVDDIEFTLVPR